MKTNLIILIAASSMISSIVLAGSSDPIDGTVQNIHFSDLKVACTNPARYHNQTAPANIQISCSDLKTKWIADPAGSVTFPVSRLVTTSVISNKYTVTPVAAEVAIDPQAAACEKYKEVTETVESVHTATCEQIVAYEGTGEEYCASNLDALKLSNPEAIKTQDTGKTADLCTVNWSNK